MNRLFFLLMSILLSSCIFTSCNSTKAYNTGFTDDYSVSYSKACIEPTHVAKDYYDGYDRGYTEGFDDGYNEGYDEGFHDGRDEVSDVIVEATDYARDKTGWSVYEAWCNIAIYNDGIHPYGYELPTEEEYHQSIETLVVFCEYLDNAGLGG